MEKTAVVCYKNCFNLSKVAFQKMHVQHFLKMVFFQRLKQIYFKENLRLSGITLLYTQGCLFDISYCILWFVFNEFLYSKTTCYVFMFCKDFWISVDFNMMKILPCFAFWLDNFLIYLIFIFSFFNVFLFLSSKCWIYN